MVRDMTPSQEVFRSYAQNQEDVVLYRALGGAVDRGHYLEVGAYHPSVKSTSYALYERGWRGILVEPQEEFAHLCRAMRPDDCVVQALIGDSTRDSVPFYRVSGGARSTMVPSVADSYPDRVTRTSSRMVTLNDLLRSAEWAREAFHFMVLDVEGAEANALRGIDLDEYRPWIIVVESVHPVSLLDSSAEWRDLLIAARYCEVMFDGVSRYFLAEEHQDLARLIYPACSTDHFVLDVPPQASLEAPNPDGTESSNSANPWLPQLAASILGTTLLDVNSGSDGINALAALPEEGLVGLEKLASAIQVATSRARVLKTISARSRTQSLSLNEGCAGNE
ncbi:FkbM family methyltransferase [Propionicimonas paludicola]|uniref:FkbM family methyltransferase n=1 Tax=Propionicimonas paludicola TaxID=185243 RepID=UPI000BF4D0C6|nr:FkbM family methyltransferase [Propionicimonas paludicola]